MSYKELNANKQNCYISHCGIKLLRERRIYYQEVKQGEEKQASALEQKIREETVLIQAATANLDQQIAVGEPRMKH